MLIKYYLIPKIFKLLKKMSNFSVFLKIIYYLLLFILFKSGIISKLIYIFLIINKFIFLKVILFLASQFLNFS